MEGSNITRVYSSKLLLGVKELKPGDYIVANEIPTLFYENPKASAAMLGERMKIGAVLEPETDVVVVSYTVDNPIKFKSIATYSSRVSNGEGVYGYGSSFKVTYVKTQTITKGPLANHTLNSVSLNEVDSVPENAKIYHIEVVGMVTQQSYLLVT